jgi:hypothetical protein
MLSHRLTDLSTIATDWRFGLIGVALSRSDGAILYWPSVAWTQVRRWIAQTVSSRWDGTPFLHTPGSELPGYLH